VKPLPQDGAFQIDLMKALGEVASSTHLTEGKFVRRLEEAVEKIYGMHAVAVSNCGTGLFALYRLIGTGSLLAPTNTFYATGGMAREAGMGVKLGDCGQDQFSMGFDQVKAGVNADTGTVALTHVGGKLAEDYVQIAKWCRENGRYLIEDAAHAFGVPGVGAMSEAAVFSFYPTKAIPAGEGGMIITKNRDLATDLRVFCNYGKSNDLDGVIRYSRGFNFRMDEWTAAVACLQVDRINTILDNRQADAERLMKVIPPLGEFSGAWTNWYKYPAERDQWEGLMIDAPAPRVTGSIYKVGDQLTTAMYGIAPLPNAAKIASKHVCLPVGENLYDGKSADEITAWLRGEI
jgi:perosamine synthetase